jgi:4-hydroxy-tetrahydrodipicolinate reductase
MALNIALIGYGKMGREIEAVAKQRGHRIAARVGREGAWEHMIFRL